MAIVHAGAASVAGRQGLPVFLGVSAESVGSEHLCAHLVELPPGGRARAHLHAAHESAIYGIRGQVITWWGDEHQHHTLSGPGDFLYIPAGMPHLPINRSATEPALALVARTDPKEQESIVLLGHLDALAHLRPDPPPVP